MTITTPYGSVNRRGLSTVFIQLVILLWLSFIHGEIRELYVNKSGSSSLYLREKGGVVPTEYYFIFFTLNFLVGCDSLLDGNC
jgi:hypothetical protein